MSPYYLMKQARAIAAQRDLLECVLRVELIA
jgi:hypothetical protein